MSHDTYTLKPYSNRIGPYEIRRWYLQVQEVLANEDWETSGKQYPQRKIVVGAAVRNPFGGEAGEAPSALVGQSGLLGHEFGKRLVQALAGQDMVSFGKAALVGQADQSEHADAFLTTAFTDPIRHALGCTVDEIPSAGRRGTPGGAIDIPLVPARTGSLEGYYDLVTASFEDAPAADEIVVLFAVSSGDRVRTGLCEKKPA